MSLPPSNQVNTECTVAFFYTAEDQLKAATTKLNSSWPAPISDTPRRNTPKQEHTQQFHINQLIATNRMIT